MRNMWVVCVIGLFASLAAESRAQAGTSLFDTLYPAGEIRIRLTYPFDSIYRSNREEIEATISIGTRDGWLLEEKSMSLNLRGKFRRMKCTAMPPLQLNFKKSDLRALGLMPIDDYKLVTHCIEGDEGVENLQEERLCYQAYEALTPYAYRTLWAEVTYCDENDPASCYTTVGFILESDPDISKRLHVSEHKIFNVAPDSLDFEAYSRVVSFNFLIGNRDWSIVANRNAKMFYSPAHRKYITIPYDFDFSNVVAASYRRETLAPNVTHPFDRLYQGEYFSDRSAEILKNFLQHEMTLLEAIGYASNPIDPKRRNHIIKYLEHGFKHIRKCKPEDMIYGMVCPYKGNL